MRAREFIAELTNTSYPYRKVTDLEDKGIKIWEFNTKDGSNYLVRFSTGIYDNYETTNIMFVRDDPNAVIRTVAHLTNTGDSLKILSTIKHILTEFLKENSPDVIKFSASRDEPSRMKLYSRAAKSMDLFPGYSFKGTDTSLGDQEYIFLRNDLI